MLLLILNRRMTSSDIEQTSIVYTLHNDIKRTVNKIPRNSSGDCAKPGMHQLVQDRDVWR